jgi:hypothetical protein
MDIPWSSGTGGPRPAHKQADLGRPEIGAFDFPGRLIFTIVSRD